MEEDGLDSLLNTIGFGQWQMLGLVTNFIIWLVLSPSTIGATLFNAPVPFNCFSDQKELIEQNRVLPPYASYGSPTSYQESKLNKSFENNCFSGEVDYNTTLNGLSVTGTVLVEDIQSQPSQTTLQTCPHVQYDPSIFSETVTTEWNLICQNENKRTLFQDTFAVGQMIGGIVGGTLGDKYGRAKILFLGSILHTISICIVAFTTNFPLLLIARFIVGVTCIMNLITGVTLSLETCPEKTRGPIGILIGVPYSFGIMLFAVLGIFLRNWRYLYIATCLPALLLVPFSWFIDESPRWLIQTGRREEAEKILKKAARLNSSQNNNEDDMQKALQSIMQEEEMKSSKEKSVLNKFCIMKEFTRYPAMIHIHIASPIIWCLNEIVYYGIIFNANRFASKSPFAYIGLTGLADCIANLLAVPCVRYLGRRATIASTQYISAALMLIVLAMPEAYKWMQWTSVMAGFLMCAIASQALYVYTPELFPTTSRATGFAISSLSGSIGTLLAPFIPEYLAKYAWWMTRVTLGCFGIFSASLIMSLPETNELPLCETLQDVEDRSKKINRFSNSKGSSSSNSEVTSNHVAKPELNGIDNPTVIED